MKTVKTVSVKTETSHLVFGYWDAEGDEFIEPKTAKDYQQASKHFGCSVEMVDALVTLVELVRDYVQEDLLDIWKRMDKAGI